MEEEAATPSTRLARAKGEMLPRRIVTPPTVLAVTWGDQHGKHPCWVLERRNANERREQRIKGEMEGFDSEQKRIISVIICEKHS